MIWVILVPSVLIGLVTARAVAGAVAYSDADRRGRKGRPSQLDWAGGWIPGIAAGVLWPVVLGLFAFGWSTAKLFGLAVKVGARLPSMGVYVGAEHRARKVDRRSLGVRGMRGRLGQR